MRGRCFGVVASLYGVDDAIRVSPSDCCFANCNISSVFCAARAFQAIQSAHEISNTKPLHCLHSVEIRTEFNRSIPRNVLFYRSCGLSSSARCNAVRVWLHHTTECRPEPASRGNSAIAGKSPIWSCIHSVVSLNTKMTYVSSTFSPACVFFRRVVRELLSEDRSSRFQHKRSNAESQVWWQISSRWRRHNCKFSLPLLLLLDNPANALRLKLIIFLPDCTKPEYVARVLVVASTTVAIQIRIRGNGLRRLTNITKFRLTTSFDSRGHDGCDDDN